mgnify:CR=1 FL=1
MADFSQMSDEQLAGCVSSAESGEAVAEMVSRYTGLVLALAGKYSGGADYEELVSGLDALLSALRKYSPEKGSFSGFASVCVSNRMKNAVDRAKRRNERLEELADEDIPDSSPTPEELVIGRESADEITRCMRSLLSPLELGCIEGVILGMPYSEIAEKLSVSVKSVDNAVTRARAKLKLVFPRL